MAIDDKIEKLQYDIEREAAKISVLSSGKIDKYKYLTGEQILHLDQSREIRETTFTYSPLEAALERQIKTNKDQRKMQADALKVVKQQKTNKS